MSPRAWAVFLLVVAADVIDLLSTTVTNVAAPTIVRDLGASWSLAPWLGASYTLAMGSLMIVGGRLGDRFGCRRLFLIGLAGFTLCSLADALAATPFELVAFRIGQGAFGGLLIPQGFVLLVRVIPRESMGMMFGLSWRSVFLLNVLFGVLMLAAGLRVIPPFGGDGSVSVRPGAAMTLMAGLGLLLAGLVDGGTSEWTARALVGTAAGAVALAAFGWQQARTSRPLLERSLFGNRGFVAGLVFGALFFSTVTGVMYVTALYLQQRLGLSPFHAAVVTAPVFVGIIAASFTVRSRIAAVASAPCSRSPSAM
ncbi:MFS transporter [Microbispora sp. CA-102843]|uniref:MFS transporter n=1 Tax=Microbispora sp. CA-102843 TaxID=3239952 RepID=UPI003D94B11A